MAEEEKQAQEPKENPGDVPAKADDDTDWKAQARKWEQRAKENSKAAKELEKLKREQMSESERLQAELEEAKGQAERLQAEKDRSTWALEASERTGVPLGVLRHVSADTEEEFRGAADEIAALLNPKNAVVVETDGKQPREEYNGSANQWLRDTLGK